MESNQTLFSLTIDPITKSHLSETAKWGRFLAILGMIFLGLLILFFMGIFSFLPSIMGFSLPAGTPYNFSTTGFIVIMAFYLIAICAIWFFPLLFLLRFSNQMRAALNGNNQNELNSSFQNLKRLFRYVGIVTIIALAIYVLIAIIALISFGAMSH